MTSTVCAVCGAATELILCQNCVDRLARDLGDFPALLNELTVTETGQAKVYRSSRRMSPEPEDVQPERDIPARLRSRDPRVALPATGIRLNEDAAEVREIVLGTLSAWARHLAESRGVECPTDRTLIGWLLTNVHTFAVDEAGGEAFEEITYAHRRLERAIDRAPSRTFWGRCDDADCGRDLYAKDGATSIVCDGWKGDGEGCGASHSVDDIRAGLRNLLSVHLAPLDAIKAVLPLLGVPMPKPGLWRSWLHRKQLQPRGRANGVALFSGREVLELVLDEGNRRGPKRGAA